MHFSGNPLYIIGYCNLMLQRSLGEIVPSSASRSKQHKITSPYPGDVKEIPPDQRERDIEVDRHEPTEINPVKDENSFEVHAQATHRASPEGAIAERGDARAGRGTIMEEEEKKGLIVTTRTVFRCSEVPGYKAGCNKRLEGMATYW